MSDLEDVDRAQEPAISKQLLDRHMRVAGEQRREAAEPEQADDRRVVDVALGQRRADVVVGRIQQGEAGGWVQPQPLSRPREDEA
ncbi:MAG: hypothetical protein ACXWMG_05565, partial [Candidatus Limnocylindria bacterium]